jgi:hypothetical protein
MAASAVLARVAIAIASDKRVQNFLLAIVAGVIAFIFLIAGTFFSIMDQGTSNNQSIIACAFSLQDIPANADYDTAKNIKQVKNSFTKLDSQIESANSRLSDKKLDSEWVKSVLFAIFFEKEQPADDFYNSFVNCFITTETINGIQTIVPLTDKNILFDKLENELKLPITNETITLASEVYSYILFIEVSH